MKIEIRKAKKGWFWRIVAANHKVLAHSETYVRRRDAVHAAELVSCFGGEIPIFII